MKKVMMKMTSKKNKWGKREEYLAEILGMKRQPFSGAGLFDKEDLISKDGETLAQIKSTEGESIKIQKQDLLKLYQHAVEAKKKNAFFILDFVGEQPLLCMTLGQLSEIAQSLFVKEDVKEVQGTENITLNDIFDVR